MPHGATGCFGFSRGESAGQLGSCRRVDSEQDRPRTLTITLHVRIEISLDPHMSLTGVVGGLQPERAVDLPLAGGVGSVQHLLDVAQPLDEFADLVLGQSLLRRLRGDAGFGFSASGLGFGDPRGDEPDVDSGLERGRVWRHR